MRRPSIWLTLLILLSPALPLHAQTTGSYLDPGAAALVARARSFRDAADSSILSYTGTVRTRMAAGLRMPLKDRTLYRRESASRIRWSRDAAPVIKIIAYREQTPSGVTVPGVSDGPGLDEMFDPTQDRIYFGLSDRKDGDEEIWIEHPLVEGAEKHYRYQSGDTVTIRMQDGRSLRAIELRVMPRESSGHLVSGSLWIDASNGTVVQALYRLARPLDIASEVMDADDRADMSKVPGMFKPMIFDITLVAIEYALFDFKYWMPHVTRLEGYMRAGVVRVPASYEISYDIDDVISATPETVAREASLSDSVASAWNAGAYVSSMAGSQGRPVRLLMPRDPAALMKSPDLPPPVWETSGEFITGRELDDLHDRISRIAPRAQIDELMPSFVWGMGAPDLLRYNRVESLSIGARASTSMPLATLSATARIGLGDLHPNIEIAAVRATHRRTISLSARHALAAVDPQIDPFGMGNSASALLLGRDDGEYYRATGAMLTFSPAETSRGSYALSLFAQHDDSVKRETSISLRRIWQSSFRFRDNIAAAPASLAGASLSLRPWWGSDPHGLQGGLDFMIEGALTNFGDNHFARTRLTARTAIPLGQRQRIGLEAAAGTAAGDVPPQRLWYLGGAATLRGYDGSTLRGTSFARARADIARSFGWGGLTLFSDGAWAGERRAYAGRDVVYSVGVGSTVLDGLVRVDLARALNAPKKWRVELYMDALL